MPMRNLWRRPAPVPLPELDERGLEDAADTFFPNGIGVTDTAFAVLSAGFYGGVDIAARGEIWRNGDVASLHRAIPLAIRHAAKSRQRPSVRRRLLVIGCGDGRLLGTIGAICLLYGITEIVLNDLHPFHVEAAREVIRAAGVEKRGLSVRPLPGDITAVAAHVKADVALAFFFVDAEVISVASVADLRAKRQAYRDAIARCLGPGGVLLMDRPEVGTGFYAAVSRMTRRILTRRGVMPGEEANLDLAWIPGGTQPYHLRYAPEDETHRAAMRAAGFRPLEQRIQVPQDNAPAGLVRRKVVEVWQVDPSRAPEMPLMPGLLDAADHAVTARQPNAVGPLEPAAPAKAWTPILPPGSAQPLKCLPGSGATIS